jgi:hypothetical protein
MKRVIWKNGSGHIRCSLLRDDDDPNKPEIGIPVEPPPIDQILEDAKTELREALIKSELFTWDDVQNNQGILLTLVKGIIHQKLVMAYRQGVK